MRGDPYLVVRLCGQEYLVPTDGVAAVLRLQGQRIVPARPHGLLRHRIQMHGRWIPAGAPHEALGLQPRSFSARSGLILIERPRAGPSPLRFGVIVDSLSRIEQLASGDVRLGVASHAACTLGHARLKGKWRPILDLDAIFPPALVLSVPAA
jgi:chemotaxis signal transduction protein